MIYMIESSQNRKIKIDINKGTWYSEYMQVIPKSVITDFVKKHPDGKSSIESWYHEAKQAAWKTSMDIKNRYSTVSFLRNNYVIFNIKGRSYRMVTRIAYKTGYVFIKWIGTHAEYSKKSFP